MAAKEEGITEVPCVFVDYLTEAQKKAYVLADNRMAWDEVDIYGYLSGFEV